MPQLIGYVCKYTPIEIFEAFGETTNRIAPNQVLFDHADAMMHANMCFYAKGVLEEMLRGHYDGLILTTCCDSIKRLYDVLHKALPEKFIYLLEVPRKVNDLSITFFKKQLIEMIEQYQFFSGKTFNEQKLYALLSDKKTALSSVTSGIQIGVLGARCPDYILESLTKTGAHILFDKTCTGISRPFTLTQPRHIMTDYAASLLHFFPCMRMEDTSARDQLLQNYVGQLDGLVYHTVKFCDHYSYEYAQLKKTPQLPILKLETDYSMQCEGQVKTRLEAFIESIKAQKHLSLKRSDQPFQTEGCHVCYPDNNAKKMISIQKKRENLLRQELTKEKADSKTASSSAVPCYVIGIDSGSTSTNAVILGQNQEMIAFHIIRTGAKSGESAIRVLEEILTKTHLSRDNISMIVSTGYGRVSIPFADKNVTEISCHGKGAHFLNPKVHTILDIGGQDSKAIKLNDEGEVIDFVMNDKCAAGTGRFLEMMARTLDVDIRHMGSLSLKAKEDITISSMCSVFAESEVISLIAQNKEKADIIHGIHKGIAAKSAGLMSRIGMQGDYMMTGGVAQNIGVVKAIEDNIKAKLFIPPEPEIVGALGAALFALESL